MNSACLREDERDDPGSSLSGVPSLARNSDTALAGSSMSYWLCVRM